MSAESTETFGIAELARRAEVTPRTIRYYVAQKLLPPPAGAGQRRAYGEAHLLRLRAIRRLKADYLPLAEIRRRLANASLEDLRRLVDEVPSGCAGGGPEPATPLLLSEPARWRPEYAAPASRAGGAMAPPLLGGRTEATVADHRLWGDETTPSATTPTATVWRRVALAPGVELHYQITGDRRRDALIGQLVREAARLLGEGDSPGEPRSHLGF